jgi:hypothetical protein
MNENYLAHFPRRYPFALVALIICIFFVCLVLTLLFRPNPQYPLRQFDLRTVVSEKWTYASLVPRENSFSLRGMQCTSVYRYTGPHTYTDTTVNDASLRTLTSAKWLEIAYALIPSSETLPRVMSYQGCTVDDGRDFVVYSFTADTASVAFVSDGVPQHLVTFTLDSRSLGDSLSCSALQFTRSGKLDLQCTTHDRFSRQDFFYRVSLSDLSYVGISRCSDHIKSGAHCSLLGYGER